MNCTSCGMPMPDGQGNSCSMCYGDIAHGTDGYYEQWAMEQERKRQEEKEIEDRQFESFYEDYEDDELPF